MMKLINALDIGKNLQYNFIWEHVMFSVCQNNLEMKHLSATIIANCVLRQTLCNNHKCDMSMTFSLEPAMYNHITVWKLEIAIPSQQETTRIR
jgi:hypothetical protein